MGQFSSAMSFLFCIKRQMASNHLTGGLRDLWKLVPALTNLCVRTGRALENPLRLRVAIFEFFAPPSLLQAAPHY